MRSLLMFLVALVIACKNPSPLDGPAEVININTATMAELEKLPGIGPKKARSIVMARNARGGQFDSFDQILTIDGIGETTMAQLRPHVVLGPPKPKRF